MKATIASLGVLILTVLFQGMAVAAPATKTVVLYSALGANEVPLNVSACSQIRVTASTNKGEPSAGSVSLWDEQAQLPFDLFARSLNISIPAGGGYDSALLETPGMTLFLSALSNTSVVVYCR